MTQEVEILDSIKTELLENCDKRHRGVYGGRSSAKSWSIARTLLVEGMSEELFIVCVREVQKSIENSVKKLLEDTIKLFGWSWFYTITKTDITALNGTKFVFYGLHDHNADNIKSLEGADRCWIAEAQSISRSSINVLRPTIRKETAVIWWDFNPRYSSDPVYVDYVRNNDPNAKFIKVNWMDNPWFPNSLMMEKDADYARDKTMADHIWLGELADSSETFVCPPELVDKAMLNKVYKNPPGIEVIGADIAHQGGDEIVFYKRINNVVVDSYISKKQNAVTTFNDLKTFAGKNSVINIDNGSLGAAVADFLEADGYTVTRINFGGVPFDVEHYEDCATEMYFQLRDKFENISIPYDEELGVQLSTRKYDYISGRRGYEVTKIESKKDFSLHTHAQHKSPDRADAMGLCFYEASTYMDLSSIAGTISAYK